ncbi:MAG: hypothetical protein AB8H79_04310 [Myxococcota bacterium]
MSEKTCPSCGTDVPSVAKRCRECFHDFSEPIKKGVGNGPLIFLGFLAVMSVVGAATLFTITQFKLNQYTQVNQDSQFIVTVSEYVTGVSTERVPFSDVSAVQHVVGGKGSYELRVLKGDGSSMLIKTSPKSLKGEAEQYARIMDKPFTEVDNSVSWTDKPAEGS